MSSRVTGSKRGARSIGPRQGGLLGTELSCPNVEHLPLIGDDQGKLEVLAPGHLYQPLLLSLGPDDYEIFPGALEANERKFVADLVRRLYPSGNPPRALGAPLKWGDREIHLRRNLDKDPGSFRLRVDDSDWYYPDFILWVVDRAARVQTFGFVDPKGLYSQAPGGWGDHKVVSTVYMPHVIEQQLGIAGRTVEIDGESWSFRVRGVLLSTSPYQQLQTQAKFKASDIDNHDVIPSKDRMQRARILFQEDVGYVDLVLDALVHDSPLDELFRRAAEMFYGDAEPAVRDHKDAYLQIEQKRQPDAAGPFAERVLKDLLLCDDFESLKGAATKRAAAKYLEVAVGDTDIAATCADPAKLFPLLLQAIDRSSD